MQNYFELALRIAPYNVFRRLGVPRILPINYTVSITNICPSRCKTCYIWRVYAENPSLRNRELSTSEWKRIIQNLGKSPFWVTISGGEPFARQDLSDICEMICEANKPKIINIPTNGILYDRVREQAPRILDACSRNSVSLVFNLSIDEIGERHDEIRGVKDNWNKALRTLSLLKELKEHGHDFVMGVHTVISVYNAGRIPDIARYVNENLKPDNYIVEVAEERSELFNRKTGVTPSAAELKVTLKNLVKYLDEHGNRAGKLEKASLAFRRRYYELVPKIIEENKQQVPCMSSFASCQITPFGDVWGCCITGYDKPLGNLRETNYDFEAIWKGVPAEEFRNIVRKGECSCPLANSHYTSLMLNFREISRIALKSI